MVFHWLFDCIDLCQSRSKITKTKPPLRREIDSEIKMIHVGHREIYRRGDLPSQNGRFRYRQTDAAVCLGRSIQNTSSHKFVHLKSAFQKPLAAVPFCTFWRGEKLLSALGNVCWLPPTIQTDRRCIFVCENPPGTRHAKSAIDIIKPQEHMLITADSTKQLDIVITSSICTVHLKELSPFQKAPNRSETSSGLTVLVVVSASKVCVFMRWKRIYE